MRGIKIPQHVLCAKNAGGAYARGGAYLRDTTVHILHLPLFTDVQMILCRLRSSQSNYDSYASWQITSAIDL